MSLKSTMYFLAEELHNEAKYVFLPEERIDEGKHYIFGRGVQRQSHKIHSCLSVKKDSWSMWTMTNVDLLHKPNIT